jgi:polar amino acid transport system substrate-binding protein
MARLLIADLFNNFGHYRHISPTAVHLQIREYPLGSVLWTRRLIMRAIYCDLTTAPFAIVFLTLLSWFPLLTSASEPQHPIQILTVIEPPASYLNSHGELSGYATELVQALQKQIQDRSDIQIMPESRVLLTAARQPNVLLFGFSRTQDREQKYHWIMPLLRKRWVVYVHKDSPLQINNLDELRNLDSIGVVRGDVREEWLTAQGFTNLHSSASHAQNLARLRSGRLTAIAYEPQGMQYLLKETGHKPDEFKPVLHFRSSEVWLLMSRQTHSSEVQRWQLAAEELKLSGQPLEIARHWQQRLAQTEQIQSTVQQGLLQF